MSGGNRKVPVVGMRVAPLPLTFVDAFLSKVEGLGRLNAAYERCVRITINVQEGMAHGKR